MEMKLKSNWGLNSDTDDDEKRYRFSFLSFLKVAKKTLKIEQTPINWRRTTENFSVVHRQTNFGFAGGTPLPA